jgi:hypothetical protein
MSSRIAHHIDFPDYEPDELMQIAQHMLAQQQYCFDDAARVGFQRYIALRKAQPHFANARSMRNALERARLRQASRLCMQPDVPVSRNALMTLKEEDILASRVFQPT